MGRPKKKASEKRCETMVTKVTQEERYSIEGWAKHVGQTVSDFIKEAVAERIRVLASKQGGGS
jgi:uncharacterized protein (DUF1778 family)